MPELAIKPVQDRDPFRVVVDEMTDGVQHVPAFGIHVSRALSIRPVSADDWTIVSDAPTSSDHVILRVFLPKKVFDKKIF